MKLHLKQVGRAILAAVTSPNVVTIEKKVGVFLAVRGLIALGASAGLILAVSGLAK